jgi:hypothetical protein
MAQERYMKGGEPGGIWGVVGTVLLALAVTGFWYWCYYLLAPWIWSKNIPFKPEDITPWIRTSTAEHDGIEIYALYILVFVNIVCAFSLTGLIGRLGGEWGRRATVGFCALLAAVFCIKVGFIPPMSTFQDTPLAVAIPQSLLIMLVISPLIAFLYYLQQKHPRLALAAAALVLLPPCFLAISNFGWRDYTYIFAPAQRLLDGAAIRDIYFQYDLLPSLLAAAWMKLGLDLNNFRIMGQAAYYLTILGVFILSGKLFQKRELAVFLLAALILGRLYATPYDITLVFQVTPLRLDLWLPLLLVVYRFGPYHWSAGLVCGLLLILLKNFGIIYSAAYLQLLLTVWAVGYLNGEERGPFVHSLMGHGRRCAVPVTIMAVAAVASHFLFKNTEYGNFAGYYQKIGIGFIQIARNSFYWYVPALFCVAVILLFRLRKNVSTTYLTTGFLLIYCAIGNSIYFFGRSHEHNILNIAIVLLFLFFFLLDLVARSLAETAAGRSNPSYLQKYGVFGVAVALLVVTSVSYSENITKRGRIQFLNVRNAKVVYDTALVLPENFHGYMGRIREVTNNSSKVFFVDEADYAFYYFGGYSPVGYCNPFLTWIFTKDLTSYMQRLLDSGYYLVCSPSLTWLLTDLKYDGKTVVGETVVVAKQSNKKADL